MKILLVIFILFSNFVTAEVIDIDNRELSNLIEKEIMIVDVRTQNEWKSAGIIKGSILISLLDKKNKFISYYRNESNIMNIFSKCFNS